MSGSYFGPLISMDQLGADVTIVNANTYYNGPSLALPAGDWLVWASATIYNTAGSATHATVKIHDGTNAYASGETWVQAGSVGFAGALAKVTLPAAATLYLALADTGGGSATKLRASAPTNGVGNNATTLCAAAIR